jgi:Peptidase family M23
MTVIFLLQLILPIFFISLLALATPKTMVGFLCQTFGTAIALLALALTGLWLFPPWWTPYVFAGALAAVAVAGWQRQRPFKSFLPSGWTAWIFTLLFVALGGWGANQALSALTGRAQQAGTAVDLAFPLKSGTYLVVNGGSNIAVNQHLMTLDTSMARFQAYRGQSYGVDIVKLDPWGLRAGGLQPSEPSAYKIYGESVHAPCAGIVIAALDGLPDMQAPQMDRDHMAGNHVLLRCKDADVLLGHFKTGSLKVITGQPLTVGQQIASVGNSGNTGEPHLHIHAQQAGTILQPFSGNPLPVRFDGRFLVRNDRVKAP